MFDVKASVKEVAPQTIEWRRQIHRHPEVGFEEYKTAALVESALRDAGIEVIRYPDSTAVVGLLRGGKPGRTIGLRADMDALPLQELADVEFKSEVPGVMHACGHDVHTAVLMGAAKILASHREDISGTIRFFFQPAEERFPGGALGMIENGAMEGVERVFALHVGNNMATGSVGVTYGFSHANCDMADIKIIGKGGHGAAPHNTIDAVVIASHVVVALQTIVSRNVGPTDSAVISVGSIQSGSIHNIIAEEAELKLTIRSLLPETRTLLQERIEGIVKGVTQAMNAAYEIKYTNGYPSLNNDAEMADLLKEVAEQVVGADNIEVRNTPMMGGEDFAYFAQKAPGALLRLGSRPVDEEVHNAHNPKFKVNEDCIPVGLEMMVSIALKALE
jgi:amidohydrolase